MINCPIETLAWIMNAARKRARIQRAIARFVSCLERLKPIVTAWLYWGDQPIQAVRMTNGMTEQQVRQEMLAELEAVPGVICNQYELPDERRAKIYRGRLRFFLPGQ